MDVADNLEVYVDNGLNFSKHNTECVRKDHSKLKLLDSFRHLLRSYNWLNMSDRRMLHSTSSFYSILKYKQPKYLANKGGYRNSIHNVNFRKKFDMEIGTHKSALEIY